MKVRVAADVNPRGNVTLRFYLATGSHWMPMGWLFLLEEEWVELRPRFVKAGFKIEEEI